MMLQPLGRRGTTAEGRQVGRIEGLRKRGQQGSLAPRHHGFGQMAPADDELRKRFSVFGRQGTRAPEPAVAEPAPEAPVAPVTKVRGTPKAERVRFNLRIDPELMVLIEAISLMQDEPKTGWAEDVLGGSARRWAEKLAEENPQEWATFLKKAEARVGKLTRGT